VAVSINVSFAEDWPCFRGPSRQGISQEKNVPTQWSATSNIVWKRAIPGEGWSSPIVWGDRVFVTTATDKGQSYRLLCIDRKSGAVVWDREVIRQEAGHKQRLNSYASSTPATDGQNVYVVAADGSIAAVSIKGEIVWAYRDFKYYSEHGLAISPVLYKDLVIVAFDWSSPGDDKGLGWQKPWDQAVILALDKSTGKVRWKGQRGSSRIGHVVPNIVSENGRDQLVSGAGDVVQGFDLATGERIWTVSAPGEGVVPSIVIGDGLVFATSGFGESAIRAIRTGGKGDVTKTHIAWESKEDVPKIPSMLYVKPYLYLVTEGGLAKCIEAATGKVIWENRLGDKVSASPVWADGRIYFLSEEGLTTIIEAGPEFKVIAKNDIGEKCGASPAISQGQIFIRSESNLYCIGNASTN
jgi:outer membrane protein assembly factor BamB